MITAMIIIFLAFIGAFYLGTRFGKIVAWFIFRYRTLAKAKDLDLPNSCAMHAVKTLCSEIPNEKIVRGFLDTKCYDRYGSMIGDIDQTFNELNIKVSEYTYYPLKNWVANRKRHKDFGPYFCVVWIKGSATMHATTYKDGKIVDCNFSQKTIKDSHFIGAYRFEV